MLHVSVRSGTTSLFATLDVASGKVISATQRRHRHQEFLKFLNLRRQVRPKESPGFRPGGSRSSRSYSVAVFNASYAAVSTLVMLLALK
jgi:hypothetical protein